MRHGAKRSKPEPPCGYVWDPHPDMDPKVQAFWKVVAFTPTIRSAPLPLFHFDLPPTLSCNLTNIEFLDPPPKTIVFRKLVNAGEEGHDCYRYGVTAHRVPQQTRPKQQHVFPANMCSRP